MLDKMNLTAVIPMLTKTHSAFVSLHKCTLYTLTFSHNFFRNITQDHLIDVATCGTFDTCCITSNLSNTMFEFHGVLAMFLLTSCKDDDIQDKTWHSLDTQYYKAALIIPHKAGVSAFESPEQTQFTCQ